MQEFRELTGIDLLGEVVSWSFKSGDKIPLAKLRSSMQQAGFDPFEAADLKPRSAFGRAARQLEEGRIIRVLEKRDGCIAFQLTKEAVAGDRLAYDYEARLDLNTDTGDVTGDDAFLCQEARRLMDEQMGLRSTSDVTGILKRLFQRQADLFAVRDAGGVYFVPQRFFDFLGQVETLIGVLGGRLNRFPVPKGTPQGRQSVKEAVAAGIEELIAEHLAEIDGFDPDKTQDGTFARAAERIKTTQFKIGAYAEYLEAEKARLEQAVVEARAKLKEKVLAIHEAKSEKETSAEPGAVLEGSAA